MQNDAPPDDEPDDFELFRQQMQGVQPLKPVNRKPAPRNKPLPRVRQQDENGGFHNTHGFAISDDVSDSGAAPDILSFARSGVQHSTLKKLRQGKFAIDQRIDLHGLSAEQARDYLLQFLADCEQSGARVVLMVHGKGYRSKNNIPVIKTLLNRWLRECDQVLAFHSAQPKHGGSGAVYVLLKK